MERKHIKQKYCNLLTIWNNLRYISKGTFQYGIFFILIISDFSVQEIMKSHPDRQRLILTFLANLLLNSEVSVQNMYYDFFPSFSEVCNL